MRLPAIQAVLRSQIALAAKGNGPAQRAVVETIRFIENEIAAQTAAETGTAAERPLSELDAARRIALVLERAKRKVDSDQGAKTTEK